MKFTIFTPTYNRRELLKKLYLSLKNQSYKNFEWIIVDDGSEDGTKETVNEFLKENVLNIRYFYVKNGGKQRAYNYGVSKAEGELFVCIDSDDEYVEDGFLKILKYWEKYEKNKEIAGMGYLSIDKNGDVIGTKFPENEMIDTQFNIYNRFNVKGDKGLMFRTEIIKKFPFPVFEGEKFVTEAVVYNRICEKYKILYVNEKIEIKEYQNDGLTSKYEKLLLNNPKGQTLYYNEMNRNKMGILKKINTNALYYKFGKIAGYKFSELFSNSENKVFLLISLPFGIGMYIKMRIKKIKGGYIYVK